MRDIKFGTDGWRDRIGEKFTFENLKRVCGAYALYMKSRAGGMKIAVGYDNRFLSEKYAASAADTMASLGVKVLLFDKPVPTPLVSWAVRRRGLDGGVMITSSHNPWNYSGFKIKNRHGAGISSAEASRVESFLDKRAGGTARGGSVKKADFDEAYCADIASLIDVEAIRKSGIKLALDCLHGSGAGYAERILRGYKGLAVIRDKRDPLFGGVNPEPIKQNLKALFDAVKKSGAAAGLALDGDGDRLGLADERGNYVSAHKALVFTLLHAIKNRGFKGTFIRTVSGTFLLDKAAKEHGIRLREVPIGFKNIADIMIRDKNTIGGEESGGIGFGSFLPERDGILSNLMVAEFLVKEKRSVSSILSALDKKYGALRYDRVDVKFPESRRKEIIDRVKEIKMRGRLMGLKINGANEIDGSKFLLENGGWILFRFSGTEPLLRVYCEAKSDGVVKEVLKAGLKEVGLGS